MSSRNNHYNKKLQPLARNLRNKSTQAEIRLWCELLRDKQMMGFPFLRQRPIGNYIADFFCKELKLIIELNGLTHQWEKTEEKDRTKQIDLEALGYAVLYFDDEAVMKRIEDVRRSIEKWIDENHPNHTRSDLTA